MAINYFRVLFKRSGDAGEHSVGSSNKSKSKCKQKQPLLTSSTESLTVFSSDAPKSRWQILARLSQG